MIRSPALRSPSFALLLLGIPGCATVGAAGLTGGAAGLNVDGPVLPLIAQTEFVLANGMRVVALPDPEAPLVEVDLRFAAGAKEDPPGKQGLAHLVEHLTFLERAGIDPARRGERLEEALARLALGNNAATDYGVNHDGLGNLRGYAYGANIGWINFENLGAPKVDLFTGKLSGSAYSANCGWISLSNAFAHVQTDTIAPGIDTDGDGIADAWELTYTNSLAGFGPGTDSDGDGASDKSEYLAGTHPKDANSALKITDYITTPTGSSATLTWSSVLTRQYRIQRALDLNAPVWFDSGLGLIAPDGATTARLVTDTNALSRFYRVQAIKPLSP